MGLQGRHEVDFRRDGGIDEFEKVVLLADLQSDKEGLVVAEFEVELKDWKEFLELSGVLGPFLEFLEFLVTSPLLLDFDSCFC